MKLKKTEIAAIIAMCLSVVMFACYSLTSGGEAGSFYVITEKEAPQETPMPEIEEHFPAEERLEAAEEAPAQTKEKININTASANELTSLSGVGEVIAGRIVEYREENGLFSSIEDIKNVKGIGEKTFEKLKDTICAEYVQMINGERNCTYENTCGG